MAKILLKTADSSNQKCPKVHEMVMKWSYETFGLAFIIEKGLKNCFIARIKQAIFRMRFSRIDHCA